MSPAERAMRTTSSRTARPAARVFVTAFVGLIAAGLLVGCGSDKASDPVATSKKDPFADALVSDGEQGLATLIVEGRGFGSTKRLDVTKAREQQNAIQSCMKDQGFTYVPHISAALTERSNKLAALGAMTRREFAKRYGFGISTTVAADGHSTLEAKESGSEDDPNTQIVAGLSQADATAYFAALSGSTTTPGCDRGDGGGDVSETDAVATFADIEARITNDTRVQQAMTNYSACMKTAGFASTSPSATRGQVEDELQHAWGPGGRSGVVQQASGDAATGDDKSEVEAAPDKALLAAAQRFELAIAAANLSCLPPVEKVVGEVGQAVQGSLDPAGRDALDRSLGVK